MEPSRRTEWRVSWRQPNGNRPEPERPLSPRQHEEGKPSRGRATDQRSGNSLARGRCRPPASRGRARDRMSPPPPPLMMSASARLGEPHCSTLRVWASAPLRYDQRLNSIAAQKKLGRRRSTLVTRNDGSMGKSRAAFGPSHNGLPLSLSFSPPFPYRRSRKKELPTARPNRCSLHASLLTAARTRDSPNPRSGEKSEQRCVSLRSDSSLEPSRRTEWRVSWRQPNGNPLSLAG